MHRKPWSGVLAVWVLTIAPPAPAQQVDTIRVGSAALRGARLQPGTYTIESFQRADGREVPISTTTQAVSRERLGDLDVYIVRTTHASPGDTTIGVIVARAGDFALLHHRVTAKQDSTAVAVAAGHVTGWVVLPDEPIRLIDQQLERSVFPIEGQIPWLFPVLPLAPGYSAAVPHYSQWQGREEWDTIRVVGSERLLLGGSAFDCWRVDGGELFPGYTVTYWVDKGTRRVLQGVARGVEPGPEFLVATAHTVIPGPSHGSADRPDSCQQPKQRRPAGPARAHRVVRPVIATPRRRRRKGRARSPVRTGSVSTRRPKPR